MNNWQIKKLSELGCFTKGSGITKKDIKDNGLSCIRYAELYTLYNIIIKKCFSYIDRETSKKSKKIKYNDILFAGSGETKEEIAKCAVCLIKNEDVYVGGDTIIFSPKSEINSIFLSYYLNTIGRKQLDRLGQGHSIVHIYPNKLANVYIPVPPLAEQEKIVSILSKQDEVIEKLEDLIELKVKQKKGLMQKLLSGKVRLPKILPLFEGEMSEGQRGSFFEGSESAKLSTPLPLRGTSPQSREGLRKVCATLLQSREGLRKVCVALPQGRERLRMVEQGGDGFRAVEQSKKELKIDRFDGEWKNGKLEDFLYFAGKGLRPASFLNNNGNIDFIISSSIVKKCDIADFNCEALLIGDGGFANIHYLNGKFSASDHVYILLNKNNHVNTKYIYYFLDNNIGIIQKNFAGVAIKNISKTNIKNLKIYIPPTLEEQSAIASILSKCDEEIELLKKKLELNKKQKKWLMQKLLSGEIRVDI